MKVVKIGRTHGDVIVPDGTVSSSHCQIIQYDDGKFILIDTNSLNGTYVNGVLRRGEVTLNRGDIIRIGNSTIPWESYFSGKGPDPNPDPDPDPKPSSFLAWSIVATILCCLPFGVVSIVYASKVDTLWNAKDFTGARDAAHKAKVWFWWSFGIGLVAYIAYIIYIVCAVFALL